MIKVGIEYHQDGDHLIVSRCSWWHDIYENVVFFIFADCTEHFHPLGLLYKSDRIATVLYEVINKLLSVAWNNEKEMLRVPIEDGCRAYAAIWPENKDDFCWRDDCEIHPYFPDSSEVTS